MMYVFISLEQEQSKLVYNPALNENKSDSLN